MFTFANPFLLWAFPVLILPWIFRRRQEERVQKIEFPLIRFLIESEEKDLINPRLQELLLLLLRTLLLFLLLLALAGPKWNADDSFSRRLFSFLPVGTPVQSSVVVIDSSYSMGYGQGESSWWNRSMRAAEQINRELSGFNTTWLWWNQETMQSLGANQISTFSYSEIHDRYDTLPTHSGTSIGELLSVLDSNFDGQERVIVITDGQRHPWKQWLESSAPNPNIPHLLVITIGDSSAQNLWIETSEMTPPPWGIAIAEAVTGSVKAINANQNVLLSVYERKSGKSIYNQPVSFSAANNGVVSAPFQFHINSNEFFTQPQTGSQDNAVTFMMELDQQDGLAIDNRLELNIPFVEEMQLGIAYDSALPPVEFRFITSAFLDSVAVVPLIPPGLMYSTDIHLTVLTNYFVSGWTPADTMNTIEYWKNGGNVLIFSDANGNSAWNNLLEEMGWTWNNATESNEFRNVSIAGGEGLPAALQSWSIDMWEAWKPAVHGRINTGNAKPVVTYQSGENEFHLIAEAQNGKGKAWLVNANLQSSGDAVWSPVLPSILWESAKEAARSQSNYKFEPPQLRWESDLTMLSDDDKKLLHDNYGIQFIQPEDAAQELHLIYGDMDLRYLLLMLTIFTALVESWLSNRLASL